MNRNVSGQQGLSLPHESAHLQVSGKSIYIDDLPELAGTLHTYLYLSPHAHARLINIDLAAVYQSEGVFCVVTGADFPGVNNSGIIVLDEPLLADDLVSYQGQPIFAVAASSIGLARKAAKLAKIEWHTLPAIIDPIEAYKKKQFLSKTPVMLQGEPEKPLNNPALTHHHLAYRLGGQEQFYLEGQVSYAQLEEQGQLKVAVSTQHPSEVQHLIARALALADNQVIVETRRIGGGFGGKETQAAQFACIASLLCLKTGRPVKIRLDRDDDMVITGKRHPFDAEIKLALDAKKNIVAYDLEMAANGGFSLDLTNPVADRAMFHADSTYFVSNRKICAHRLRTNIQSNTAFRGFGGPQGAFFVEQAIEDLGHYYGLDPLDLRYQHYYQNGQHTHYGQEIEDSILTELSQQLEKSSEYRTRRKYTQEFNRQHSTKKRGIAFTPVKFGISFTLTEYNQAGALVLVYTDGSIQVNHGGIEMGQGLFTKIAQLLADVFQVGVCKVRSMATRTDKVPNTSATAASSGTDLNAMAVYNAAMTIKDRMVEYLAHKYSIRPEQIKFDQDQVLLAGEAISFAEAAKLCKKGRVALSATGFYKTPKIHWDSSKMQGRPFYYFSYGASVTEVEIDTFTGEYQFLRTDILHDCGRSLNPAIDKGQILGAFAQGLGWLTIEELVWSTTGALLTHSPSTYKIPTSADMPLDIRLELFEGDNREETIFHSKAVGEPPLLHGFSAFFALKDAIYSVASPQTFVRLDAPATPEKVLHALALAKQEPKQG